MQAHLAEIAPHVRTAVQEQQLGTGHAVQCGLAALADLPSLPREIVVTYGDVPMLTSETLADLLADHRSQRAAVTVLTAVVADPTGYGRVVRDADGRVVRASSSTATPTTRSGRSPRSTPASTSSTLLSCPPDSAG